MGVPGLTLCPSVRGSWVVVGPVASVGEGSCSVGVGPRSVVAGLRFSDPEACALAWGAWSWSGVPLHLVARSLRGAGWGVDTGPVLRAQPWGRGRLSWAYVGHARVCAGAGGPGGCALCCAATTPPKVRGAGGPGGRGAALRPDNTPRSEGDGGIASMLQP